jgi:hypothetical protein
MKHDDLHQMSAVCAFIIHRLDCWYECGICEKIYPWEMQAAD